jgi:phage terminase small subunit
MQDKQQQLEIVLSQLSNREKEFVLNYSLAKSKTALLKQCGYSVKNPTTQVNRLLSKVKIQQALLEHDKLVKERLTQSIKLNAINRENILIKCQEIIDKEGVKEGDRLTSLALQSKILGLTKDQPTVNIPIFSQFNQSNDSNTANDAQAIDIE